MGARRRGDSTQDRSLALLLVGVGALITPAQAVWASADAHWLLPYLLWGGFIGLIALMQRRREAEP